MPVHASAWSLALLGACLTACVTPSRTAAVAGVDRAPAVAPPAAHPPADAPPARLDVDAARAAPETSGDEAPLRLPAGPIVVGTRAPLTLTAPSFPRVDRARRVITVADTGDDRFAFQSSLSLHALRPGERQGQLSFEVFSRQRFEALESDPPALERAIHRAAFVANTKLGTRALGQPMSTCAVAPRETDDASSCARGQTIRCDTWTGTFEGVAGVLRHPDGVVRHPLWAKTSLRSPEHATSFDVVACLREIAWDAETRLLVARVDRQCVASGGDWCSREPVWTAVALPPK